MGKRMTRGQTIQAHAIMKEQLVKETDGLYAYRPGWDDKKVGQMVELDSVTAIANLRTEMFGNLREHRPAKALTSLQSIWDMLGKLEQQLIELTSKYDTLCEDLTVGQVKNVRHLKMKTSEFRPGQSGK
jgi:hypothetical protein